MRATLQLILVVLYLFLADAQPPVITLPTTQNNLQPEGIDYLPSQGFLLSSLVGTQLALVTSTGATSLWGNVGHNSAGIKVDATHQIIYVATLNSSVLTNPNHSGYSAGVAALHYNGSLMWHVDLTALTRDSRKSFANDIAFDSLGNLYVTDSLGWSVWRISPNQTAEIFYYNDTLLSGDPNVFNIGPNGILLDESKNILLVAVVNATAARLVKINIQSKSGKLVNIINNSGGFDGLLWDTTISDKSALYAVGGLNVYRMTTTDNWDSATISQYFPPLANVSGSITTICAYNGSVYGIYDHIFQAAGAPPSIVRASPMRAWPVSAPNAPRAPNAPNAPNAPRAASPTDAPNDANRAYLNLFCLVLLMLCFLY